VFRFLLPDYDKMRIHYANCGADFNGNSIWISGSNYYVIDGHHKLMAYDSLSLAPLSLLLECESLIPKNSDDIIKLRKQFREFYHMKHADKITAGIIAGEGTNSFTILGKPESSTLGNPKERRQTAKVDRHSRGAPKPKNQR